MIYFDEKNKMFYLENEKITYAFGINSLNVAEHVYFGKKTGRDLYMGSYSKKGMAHRIMTRDKDRKEYNLTLMPSELHTILSGDFNEPTIILRYKNGNRRSDFTFEGYEILENKPSLDGLPSIKDGQTLKIIMTCKGVKLEIFYSVNDEAAITRSMKITNETEDDVFIERALSFSLDLPGNDWVAGYLHGGSGAETKFEKTDLKHGTFSIGSKRGASSSVLNPFMALLKPNTTEDSGSVYGVNIIYSGSHTIKADCLESGIVRVCGGINDFDFEWKLEKGESFTTPEAVLVYSDCGLSGMSREFHDIYRNHLIPKQFVKKSRPIVINNWEATRFMFTMDKLKGIVERVAGTGIDTFVLDDGWFGKRDDAFSGLGDWFVNEKKMNGTLKSFIDFVHSKGMRFGLWFEPEMVNRDSDLFRNHPDFAMQTPDEKAEEGRNQLVLDLTRKEVREYIANSVNKILDEYEIDYVKWDCNRDLTEGYSLSLPADRQHEVFHRQILGLYDLFDRIIGTHPDILFEGCASGGSRFDAGMLNWFPQIWTSDQTDAPSRGVIQYGNSMCYPLSAQSCHTTESPNRRAKHIVPLYTRAAVAALGTTGYELDATKMTDQEVALIPEQVKEYRESEDLILSGDLYRLFNPLESNFFGFELVSKDKCKAKITVMKYLEKYNEPEPRIYVKGLLPDADYLFAEKGEIYKGSTLMNFGFTAEYPDGDFETAVFHFIKK